MAFVGTDLKKYLNQKFDKSYSGYFDDTKLNRLVRESAYRSAEIKYRTLVQQKEHDELRGFIKVNQVITLFNSQLYVDPIQISNVSGTGTVTITTSRPHYLANGQTVTLDGIQAVVSPSGNFVATVTTSTEFTISSTFTGPYIANSGTVTPSNSITDYYHYLTSKVKILGSSITITGVTTGTTTIITATNHNLRTGDTIIIASVGGVTGINEEHSNVTVLNKNKFSVGTTAGTYTSGGTLQLVNYNYANLLRSDKKIFVYSTASQEQPKYQLAESILFYTPLAEEVTIDYMTKLPIEIDITNSVIDLEIYYNPKFLYFICDQVVLNEGAQVRDIEIQQSASRAIVDNP